MYWLPVIKRLRRERNSWVPLACSACMPLTTRFGSISGNATWSVDDVVVRKQPSKLRERLDDGSDSRSGEIGRG